jgi:hypothetical protein
MNDQPRQKLREIVARHGPSVVRDVRRCEGLLKDYSAEYRREVSVLVSALEEHVPQDLSAASAGTPRPVLLARLARRVSDNRALSEPAAAWAVNSWALALGLISDDDLKTLEESALAGSPAGGAGGVEEPERAAAQEVVANAGSHGRGLPGGLRAGRRRLRHHRGGARERHARRAHPRPAGSV